MSWTGVAHLSSAKGKNLGESCRAKKKNWLLSMNYQNSRESKLSWAGPDYTREAPGIVYEGSIIKPISCIYDGTPDSFDRVRGLDNLPFSWLVRPSSLRLLEPPNPLPYTGNVQYFR